MSDEVDKFAVTVRRLLGTTPKPHSEKRGPDKPSPRPSCKKRDEDRGSPKAGGNVDLQSDHDAE